MRKERDDLRDQLLRSRAEFANYQKRAKQQADADRAYAIGNLAHDLLEAIDNLERATDALRSSAAEGISSGLEMVQKQLLTILSKYGVEPHRRRWANLSTPTFTTHSCSSPAPSIPKGLSSASSRRGTRFTTGCSDPARWPSRSSRQG